MRIPRIHVPMELQTGHELTLPEAATNHLVRVLRLREGAALTVFDGRGHEHYASIARLHGSTVVVQVGDALAPRGESPLPITLVQGISRGERMDWTLQKATELGVSRIVPVLTARSVVRLDDRQAAKKQEHWQQVVISACEQSGRTLVPEVAMPLSLRDYLAKLTATASRLLLNPEGADSLAGLSTLAGPVELLIGPEGGLDDDEIRIAQQAGFMSVRLGPRILRTETASVVALSVLQAMWGDLR